MAQSFDSPPTNFGGSLRIPSEVEGRQDPPEMSRVFIGVGSNQGERLGQISKAVRAVGALKHVTLSRMATISETAPVGGPPQGPT